MTHGWENEENLGISQESLGIILQRGGEELALEKVRDRMTLALTSDSPFPDEIPALSSFAIPSTSLIEVRVQPDELESTLEIARNLDTVLFASHVYSLAEKAGTIIYLTHEITIQFLPPISPSEREEIISPFGLEELSPVAGIPNTFVYELAPEASENPIKIANRLVKNARILLAEPNIIVRQETFYQPTDPFYSHQWYLYNEDQNPVISPGSHIDAEKAWEITRGKRSVVVAIADDAIDIKHPDFSGVGKIVAPRDFKDDDFSPQPESSQESHGTACAGIAIAEENGKGIVGVAPGCALMPLRTTGFLDDRTIEELFDWAITHNASVISCSWSAVSAYYPLSLRQKAAITRAATQGRQGKGCIIVFAAGNANRPLHGTIYENNWEKNLLQGTTKWLNGFAVHPDVIAVSASTSLNKKAAYSNWGVNISLCAPSNNAPPSIWLEKTGYTYTPPQIAEFLTGLNILTTDQLGELGYSPEDYTRDFGGTSSACPLVAGVAALVLSVNPNLTAKEVKQILQETTDKIVDHDADLQLGLQMGTYDRNGHSQWFGYGKVNAFKAVQKALELASQEKIERRFIEQVKDTSMAIPDHDQVGVKSTISISDTAKVHDIEVRVEIEHEFLGDVAISLISPTGQEVLLQGRTLGSQRQLKATYTLETTTFLKQLLYSSAAGDWTLQVVDSILEDKGILKHWALKLGVITVNS